jgi:hypothetical protein
MLRADVEPALAELERRSSEAVTINGRSRTP